MHSNALQCDDGNVHFESLGYRFAKQNVIIGFLLVFSSVHWHWYCQVYISIGIGILKCTLVLVFPSVDWYWYSQVHIGIGIPKCRLVLVFSSAHWHSQVHSEEKQSTVLER